MGGDATNTTPNAGTLLSEDNSDASGPLSVLSTAQTSSTLDQTTVQALNEGKLTTGQHNIIAAIGAAPNGQYSIDWAQGTEPSEVATIRQLGWIKLAKPTYDPVTRFVTSGNYELTTIGRAIYQRTDGSAATTVPGGVASSSSVDVTVSFWSY